MTCYRTDGCGPYEMYPCSKCPASKPEYLNRNKPNVFEWKMVLDDFEDGNGNREYPHCSNCGRGVYRHDAGSWCPFCGSPMKNPMR